MHNRYLIALITTALIFASACSGSKAPGSWAMLDTGTGDTFYSVNFVDEQTGWLNGQTDRSSIEIEENENSNKSPKLKPGEKPEDPLKENQGFEVLQTTDGGQTWKQIPNQFKHKIRSVWFVDPQTGWSLTIDRDILQTTDGGANWALQRKAGKVKMKLFGNRKQPEMEVHEQIDQIYFIDSGHGWAWGGGRKDEYTEQPGTFLVTIDGGQNWNPVPFPFEKDVAKIFFLDAQRAWASAMDGTLHKTTDGGLNWTKIQTKLPESVFPSIFFIDENNGWVAGRSGQMAKTTDGGRTWERMWKIKEQFKIRDIFFTDLSHGWAVGEDGAILYTPDGGQTWANASADLPFDLIDLVFISKSAGFAAGLGGAVLRFEPVEN